jgi:heat shock protein HslJ
MKTRISTLGLALAAIGLSGCVACGPKDISGDLSPETHAKVGLLGGTSWALVELNGARVNLDSVKAQPFIEFSPDGRLSGMAGCNGMFGVFEADSEILEFDGLGTTKMFCPTGMDTEGRFLEALDRTSRYRVIADTLVLHDSAPAPLARFVASNSAR